MTRKVLKPYTLSDGTFLPVGTFVSAASRAIHYDNANYENPEVFDGFRFSNIREEDGEGTKHQMVATGTDYLPFGHGRHAWCEIIPPYILCGCISVGVVTDTPPFLHSPGRFFAANELKAMLAHIVLNYDIRTAEPGVRPQDEYFATAVVPNSKATVMFRRRQT